MIICDVCESRGPTKKYGLTIITPKDGESFPTAVFDLCERCEELAHPNSFRIGMIDQRRRADENREAKRVGGQRVVLEVPST